MDRASFPRDEKNGGVSQQSTKPNIATVSSQSLVQKAKISAPQKSIQLPSSDSPTASNAKIVTRQVTSLEHPVVPGTTKSPVIPSPSFRVRECSPSYGGKKMLAPNSQYRAEQATAVKDIMSLFNNTSTEAITSRPTNQNIDQSTALGEAAILEVSQNNTITKVELVLNSILSFTSKCLTDGLKSDVITKLIIDHYKESDIYDSANIARSLLRKADRPRRKNITYETHLSPVALKLPKICKLVNIMVK